MLGLKRAGFFMETKFAVWFFSLLNKTIKYEVIDQPEPGNHCIYVFWHRNMLNLMLQRIGEDIVVLVSTSDAGQLIAGPIAKLGYLPVRGSSTRRGSRALKQLVELGKEHSIAVTPDGPSGPAGSVHPGAIQLAYLSGLPIVPVTVNNNREWVLRSWDKLRFPLFFSRMQVTYKSPIWAKYKEQFPAVEQSIRDALDDLG